MSEKVAIVCMAYGTDPSGQGPSPMMKAVVEEAKSLAKDVYKEADFILQGGYSFNGGPTESELMAKMLSATQVGQRTFLDLTSMNTIEGAEEVFKIAADQNYTKLIIVAQRFHSWRVRYTFQHLFSGTGIFVAVVPVSTEFGGNSQPRLNSALFWWPWEIAARIYTILKLR